MGLIGQSIYDWCIPILGRLGYRPFLYPGHFGLGNRPHMYDMFGNELNLWIGVIIITGRLGSAIPLSWPY